MQLLKTQALPQNNTCKPSMTLSTILYKEKEKPQSC